LPVQPRRLGRHGATIDWAAYGACHFPNKATEDQRIHCSRGAQGARLCAPMRPKPIPGLNSKLWQASHS